MIDSGLFIVIVVAALFVLVTFPFHFWNAKPAFATADTLTTVPAAWYPPEGGATAPLPAGDTAVVN